MKCESENLICPVCDKSENGAPVFAPRTILLAACRLHILQPLEVCRLHVCVCPMNHPRPQVSSLARARPGAAGGGT